MSWRYGIVRVPEGYYVVAEVYRGKVNGYAEPPTRFDSKEDAVDELEKMLRDCREYPVYRPRKRAR
jgi:hypothetical protein